MNQHYEDVSGEDQRAIYFFPLQLTNVRLIEISAKVYKPDETEEWEPDIHILLIDEEDSDTVEEFDLALSFRTQAGSKEDECFDVSVILSGHFAAIVDIETIDKEVIQRFKEHDAVMLLWPYLRETVHSITERMELDMPPLPIISPRQLTTPPSVQREDDA
jgi:preprotein translocase subunit SecB